MNPNRSLWFYVLLIVGLPYSILAVPSDSLIQVLESYRATHETLNGQKLLSMHIDIAKELVKEKEYDKAISYYESALKWSHDTKTYFEVHAELGFLYWMKSDYERALNHSELAKERADESIAPKYQADNYHRIAQLLANVGKFDDAVEHELIGLKYSENVGDSLAIAKGYAGMARILWLSDKMEEALAYDLRAMRIIEKVGSPQRIYRAYSDVGSSFTETGQLDSAMKYIMKARNIAREIPFPHGIYFTSAQLGEIYKTQKNYPKATEFIIEAITGLREEGRLFNLADFTFMLGEILAEQANYQPAIDTLYSALQIAQSIDHQTLERDIYLALSNYYEELEDFPHAYNFARKYEALKDSLMNLQVQERMKKLEKQYDVEKKNMEIQLLEKESKLERRRLYLIGLGVCFIVLLLVLLLLDHRNKYQIQSRELLERNHKEIQAQHQRVIEKRQDWQFFSNIISKNIYEYVKNLTSQLQDLSRQSDEVKAQKSQEILTSVKTDITHIHEELYHLIAFIEAGIKDDQTEILDIRYVLRIAREMLPLEYQGVIRKIFYHDLPQLKANRYKLSLLFKHILLHTIKNPGEEPLEIHITSDILELDVEGSYLIQLTIKDNGERIPQELHEEIFQLDRPLSHQSNFHLAICKKIVSLYGGSISLSDDQTYGNTLNILFPMDKVGVKTPIPQIN